MILENCILLGISVKTVKGGLRATFIVEGVEDEAITLRQYKDKPVSINFTSIDSQIDMFQPDGPEVPPMENGQKTKN